MGEDYSLKPYSVDGDPKGGIIEKDWTPLIDRKLNEEESAKRPYSLE